MIFRSKSLAFQIFHIYHGTITMQIALLFLFSISSLLNKLSTWNLHQTGNKKSNVYFKRCANLYGFNWIPVHYPLILTTSHFQYRSFTECHKLNFCSQFMTTFAPHSGILLVQIETSKSLFSCYIFMKVLSPTYTST